MKIRLLGRSIFNKARHLSTSLTYYACMIFVESPVFTRQVAELLNDEDYSDLQQFLVSQPDAGDVIQGTGGLLRERASEEAHA